MRSYFFDSIVINREGAMAQNKTQPTPQKVSEFIAGIEDKRKRANCRELMKLIPANSVP